MTPDSRVCIDTNSLDAVVMWVCVCSLKTLDTKGTVKPGYKHRPYKLSVSMLYTCMCQK